MHRLSTATGVAIGAPVVASVCLHVAIAGAILASGTVFTPPVPEAVGPQYVVVPVVMGPAPASEGPQPSSAAGPDQRSPDRLGVEATADQEPPTPVEAAPNPEAPASEPLPAVAEALPETDAIETVEPAPDPKAAPDDRPQDLADASELPAPPRTINHPPRPESRPVFRRASQPGPVGLPKQDTLSTRSQIDAPVGPHGADTDLLPVTAPSPVAGTDRGAAPTRVGPARVAPQDLAASPGNAPPQYPRSARTNGWEGTATLTIIVGTDGRCESVSLAESSGHDVLDREALKAVRRWRFVPASRFGQPVRATTDVSIVFRLR